MHYKELKQVWAELTAPGAPFEVGSIARNGVELKTYKHAPANLRDVWSTAREFDERDYLIYENERITYRQARIHSERIASWLAAQGVEPGDRIAIAMRNYPEWMLIYWACVCSGATVVGMNAWWANDEIEYALANSKPKVLFADQERLVQLTQCALPSEVGKLVAVRTQSRLDSAANGNAQPEIHLWENVISHCGVVPDCEIDPDATACLFYTSGTSGPPKGAEITHRSSVCNIYNVLFAGQSQYLATQRARNIAPVVEPSQAVALVTTPLFHVTANNCAAQIATVLGGAIVLMYRWDAGKALKLIESERVTTLSGVPLMGRELVSHPDFSVANISSLQNIGGGGAPLQPDLLEMIKNTAPNLGASSGYGMTEASGLIASISGDFFTDKPASCGPVLPTFEVVCMDENGQEVPAGDVGELWIRGATIIKGYYREPEASANAITDGWLHTGDMARIDDEGFLYIVDRKKDMVLRGGENVFCSEVEAVLYRHPAVEECCVFAVPDKRLGETVGAAVLLKKGWNLEEEVLKNYCAGLLANYKCPESLWFLVAPIPRNASGKFLKKELLSTLGIG